MDPQIVTAIQVITTSGAFIIAVIGFLTEARRRWRTRVREQAEQMTAWITSARESKDFDPLTTKNSSTLFVRNDSAAPFTRVFVQHSAGDQAQPIGVLPPKTMREYPSERHRSVNQVVCPYLFQFEDAAGREWMRDTSGRLKRVTVPRVILRRVFAKPLFHYRYRVLALRHGLKED